LWLEAGGRIIRRTVVSLRTAHIVLLAYAGSTALAAVPTGGQPETVTVAGDRLTGFVLPVEPLVTDIRLSALRARAWEVEDTRCLVLEGDARVLIGTYDLRSSAAVVWVNRIPSPKGLINQIAVYFEQTNQPASGAAVGVRGRQLLVTGSARGGVKLDVALLEKGPPPATTLVRQAQRRLAEHLRSLLAQPPPLAQRPQLHDAPPPTELAPRPGEPLRLPPTAPEPEVVVARPEPAAPPLLRPEGALWFSWGNLHVTTGEQENVITATGSVVVQYVTDRGDERWSQLTLSAQRAVVFTDPGPIETLLTGRTSAESIRGIYLEGNVIVTADKGDYTVRAPQVYYDFRANQAVIVEAVLRTYDRLHRVPIYARAEEMRQIAANQWTARRARVSTSEFFTPHFAIGARRVTVTERPGAADPEPGPQDSSIHIDSRDNTLELSGFPFMYWPRLSGSVEDIPLRSIEVGGKSSEGVGIRTKWDAFSLLGREKPDGVDAELRADGFTKRGPGGGLLVNYDRAAINGAVDLYYLHDDGEDRTSSGRDVEPDNKNRGLGLWEHQARLDQNWTFQGQASYISDETFITSWRSRDFYNRREYETAAYLKHLKDNAALTVLTKYNLNDFISNSYLLASRAYQVQKVPELAYRRYGDSFFDDAITYSMETRVSRVRFSLQTGTPAELGVPGAAFGIPPTTPIDSALRAAGYRENWVSRFDTRHEVALPLKAGALNVVPFVVGRFTTYSDDFQEFNGTTDKDRAFGAVGVRMQTQIQRVDNSVENRLFDLHRLRHIIEPRLVAWHGATSDLDLGELPVYDQAVEAIGGGTVVEAAVRNVWQTQRGGPGRWHSVDVLTVDASYVYNSDDVNVASPTPQLFGYRPEYSQFGDHLHGSAIWLLSDHFSIAGEATYDLDNDVIARGAVGAELRHSPVLVTFVEFRYIDIDKNELLDMGWNYELTPKYRVSFRPQWDFQENDLRAIRVVVTRRFPDFDLSFEVRRDEIEDETSIGASLDLVEF
jgi:lipopolysaccharide assembly outer membrane protein LptD (OstA)